MPNFDTVQGRDAPAIDRGIPEAPAESDVVVASFAQQRMWLLDRLLPMGSIYVEPKAFRLHGRLNVEALRLAFDDLVERHESLRTCFGLEDSGPVQIITTHMRTALPVEDLTGLAPAQREAEARQRAQQEGQAPFDLQRGPLFRVRLLRLSEHEHWLLLTLHHIITDGWSSGVLQRELSALYAARCRGESAGLPALPVQYADYAVWQREWLQGDVLEQQLGYWKQALAELPALDLPTDRPRPAIASFRGDQCSLELGAELSQALRNLARREGATLFMTLLAAFQVLLYRYSGQEDIAVGVPIAGRTRVELEGLIGFFVNTLVLRGDLSGEPTFSEYLVRVRSRALEAYAHQDVPFEKLVQELHPKRDLSRNPLFQVSLMLRNVPIGSLQLQGVSVDPVDGKPHESAKFDLSVTISEESERISVHAVFATDLFDRATIERMLAHWRVLLAGIVADPGQPISRLPLLTAQERDELTQHDVTPVDFPRERRAHEFFEEHAERVPQAVAVSIGDQQLTYGELNARANQLAHYLRTCGVGSEVLVGLCVERSPELVVALLAIWKAGGVYVPLDPGYPAQRLVHMLEDARPAVLLSSAAVAPRLPQSTVPRLRMDSEWAKVEVQPRGNPVATGHSCDLAYVVYTSGSTGAPKGVMIEHRQLVNHVDAMLRRLALGPDDCVVQSSPVGFDQSIWQILVPLAAGGRVALLESDAHRSPESIIETVVRSRATVLRTVPTMLAALARTRGLERCTTLRIVVCAGEVLQPRIAAQFAARCRALLFNAYGPTETTFVSTFWTCDHDAERRSIPIGTAIDNVTTYIVDRYGEPVPVGVHGELCIGGAGVGRGYWRQPALSAAAFVADPFRAEADARMYRTGDLAFRRADGTLEFCGRRDSQIKLRGVRVELGEIEAALARHPNVATAAVVARDDATEEHRIVAYFVARRQPPPNAHALREFLRATIPDGMLPAAFVELGAIPLTAHGKIDRLRLPEPDGRSLAVDPQFVAPSTATEIRVAAIFAEALGVDRIGLLDDFFALGGHSLLAMRVLGALKAALGVAINPRAFFADATVSGIAIALDAGGTTHTTSGTGNRERNRETLIKRRRRASSTSAAEGDAR